MKYIKDCECLEDIDFSHVVVFTNLKSITIADTETKETYKISCNNDVLNYGGCSNFWKDYCKTHKPIFGLSLDALLCFKVKVSELEIYKTLRFINYGTTLTSAKETCLKNIPYLYTIYDEEKTVSSNPFIDFDIISLAEILARKKYLWTLDGSLLTINTKYTVQFEVLDIDKFNLLITKYNLLG